MTGQYKQLRHSVIIEVPFFDVDSMDIVWHGHYVKYLEVARCAFLSAIGYDYNVMKANGYGWPIVQLNLKYVRPAVFGQKIRVEVVLKEYESCLKFDYVISDIISGKKLTKASSMQVAVCMQTRETQFQTPESWLQAVRNAMQNGLKGED
ncbi:4-hydroxybenzoyl-CoA thioesterase [Snodgrassella alvi]|uniref:acyl-CoA thioesterase n=1 Tax=Snodgrassella alvi TaxID=1196083 RepID=UPI0009FE7309|nr:acyl-CoA thioesterase [Snodgrassella alvi]ORF01129.1 4-hydroxybenzoyl-CoA thioesterase [Snodgrassella alvi]ORF06482.1 4-hydroxybenzoyl-CoA thioesterase [Snodgrassella alvi]ORF07858.1 4-hydroxybenzoyl-CoA thioesterase [Snodgrassella alvi]ORF12098.1 4-hydroxybenzoyl-CoA thioesterase [Snodgrassella alvi]ORF12448.1 4-hydroxybenzoyl-CoA thioesterase [Snodgrassella alvi]